MKKDYKQVSVIYSTTDDSIFQVADEDIRITNVRDISVIDRRVNHIQRIILRGQGIFPLIVRDTPKGFYIEDGYHRLQAIRNINKKRDEKIEIPFYINWEERFPSFPERFNIRCNLSCPSCGDHTPNWGEWN
jgi:hypothetical protein